MNIVFNINPLGMEGLGATLSSLIKNCSNSEKLKLWFLCSDLKTKDKNNIRTLLQQESFQGTIELVDFDAKEEFGHLRSLHGDWTTYGRLLIPKTIKSGKALYLDSDLVINLDVLELENFQTDKILSAVSGSTVNNALESSFFIQRLGWHPETAYFNAGVLLFNIDVWNANNTEDKVKDTADKYSHNLINRDQTLLNTVCEGEFTRLPKKFNSIWYPGKTKPKNVDEAILHFVGSPKPWDLFGQTIHLGYETWKVHNTTFWRKQYGSLTMGKLRRTWKIHRSTLRHLKDKLTA